MAAGRGMLRDGVPHPPWGVGDICPHGDQEEIPLDQYSPAAGGKRRSAQSSPQSRCHFQCLPSVIMLASCSLLFFLSFFFPVFPDLPLCF